MKNRRWRQKTALLVFIRNADALRSDWRNRGLTRVCVAVAAFSLGLLCCCAKVVADERGPGFGLRVGYALPLGEIGGKESKSLYDIAAGQIPLQLDFSYRIVDAISIDAFAEWGYVFPGNSTGYVCDLVENHCRGFQWAAGLGAAYHFISDRPISPWLGLSLGYEWLGIDVETPEYDVRVIIHGMMYGLIEFGTDFDVGNGFSMAPILNWSIGQFQTISADCDNVSGGLCDGGQIDNPKVHMWLQIGMRILYRLGQP